MLTLTDMISMNNNMADHLTELYQLFLKLKGPTEARELVSAIVTNTIFDIQEEGLEVSSELLSQRVTSHVNDYLEVAKATKVA